MAIDIKLEANGADSIQIGSNTVTQVYLNGTALIDTEFIPDSNYQSSAIDTLGLGLSITLDAPTSDSRTYTTADFIVKVNEVAVTIESPIQVVQGVSIFTLILGTAVFSTDTVTVTFLPTTDQVLGAFTDEPVTNNSEVVDNLVYIPSYDMSQALLDVDGLKAVANINTKPPTEPFLDGLLTESDGTTPYEPTSLQYPQNGLLELANDRIMDTQFDIDFENSDYAAYGIYDADGSTTYKIWAISISSGLNYFELYEGDQDTPIAYVDLYSMPNDHFPVPWTVTDGRPSWMPPLSTDIRTPAYISLNASAVSTPEPDGIDIFAIYSKSLDLVNILDIEGNATDYTCRLIQIFNSTANGVESGDNSDCISDYEINNAPSDSSTVNMEVYLPSGTFEFLVSGNTSSGSTTLVTDYTIDGQTKTIDTSLNNTGSHCATFTIVSTGQMYILTCSPSSGGTASILNAFRITEVTP